MPTFDSNDPTDAARWLHVATTTERNSGISATIAHGSRLYLDGAAHLDSTALTVPQRSWMIVGRPPLRVLAREMLKRLRGR